MMLRKPGQGTRKGVGLEAFFFVFTPAAPITLATGVAKVKMPDGKVPLAARRRLLQIDDTDRLCNVFSQVYFGALGICTRVRPIHFVADGAHKHISDLDEIVAF